MAKSQKANPIQKSVGTTPAQICAGHGRRTKVTVVNNGASPVNLGTNATDNSTTTGFQLAAGASFSSDSYQGPIWATATTGTMTVSCFEEYEG